MAKTKGGIMPVIQILNTPRGTDPNELEALVTRLKEDVAKMEGLNILPEQVTAVVCPSLVAGEKRITVVVRLSQNEKWTPAAKDYLSTVIGAAVLASFNNDRGRIAVLPPIMYDSSAAGYWSSPPKSIDAE